MGLQFISGLLRWHGGIGLHWATYDMSPRSVSPLTPLERWLQTKDDAVLSYRTLPHTSSELETTHQEGNQRASLFNSRRHQTHFPSSRNDANGSEKAAPDDRDSGDGMSTQDRPRQPSTYPLVDRRLVPDTLQPGEFKYQLPATSFHAFARPASTCYNTRVPG
jgi:hypothetical protein